MKVYFVWLFLGEKMKITNPEEKNLILKLTIPLFFEFLLYILVNNVDQFMLSSYSQEAVAAVGNAGQICWVMTLFFGVCSMASVVLVSQCKGADSVKSETVLPESSNTEKAIYAIALIVNIILGIIVSVICLFGIDPILGLLKVEPGLTYEYSKVYIQIVGGLIVFQAVENCFAAYLKSNALVKEALVISIIVNVLNVAGNAVALYVLDWGVAGVAWSSAIARALGMLLAIIVFVRKVGHIDLRSLKSSKPFLLLWKMIKIGGPSIGENMSYDVSQLVIMSFINPMGLATVNAKIYVAIIVEFAYLAAMASSEAMQIVEGQLIGAGKKDKAQKEVFKTQLAGLIIVEAITALLVIFSNQIIGVFPSADADVLRIARQLLFVELFLEIGRVTNIIMVRALQTAGDVNFPIFMSIIFTWCVSVLFGYIFGVKLEWGAVGIWIACASDELMRGCVLTLRFKKGGWKKINLIGDLQTDGQSDK